LLEAVAREQPGKTQQAGNNLAGAVVICELWRSPLSTIPVLLRVYALLCKRVYRAVA
jgi:hypothetical protein